MSGLPRIAPRRIPAEFRPRSTIPASGSGWRRSSTASYPNIAGGQPLSTRYTNRLTQAGIEPSVSSVGDSYHNALAESVIGLYKTELELIHKRASWKDLNQVEYATLEYVDWFNHRRLLEPIGEPPRVSRRLYWLGDNGVMGRLMMYSPEVRERAVRMVLEHRGEHRSEWAAICSIAEKFGCSSETLRKWVRRAETDQGLRPGLSSDQLAELKELRRENRELRRANEILRKASAYFAQAELDRRPRR